MSSTTKVEGVGTVAWRVIDLYGVVYTIKTRAYYIPSASIRLFSPQRHFQQSLEGALTMNWEQLNLQLPGPSKSVRLTFPYQPNGLPMANVPGRFSQLMTDAKMWADKKFK